MYQKIIKNGASNCNLNMCCLNKPILQCVIIHELRIRHGNYNEFDVEVSLQIKRGNANTNDNYIVRKHISLLILNYKTCL